MAKRGLMKAFDDTGLNVYRDVVGFGRTKSISFRLFRAVRKSNKVSRIHRDSISGARHRKAIRKLKHFKRIRLTK